MADLHPGRGRARRAVPGRSLPGPGCVGAVWPGAGAEAQRALLPVHRQHPLPPDVRARLADPGAQGPAGPRLASRPPRARLARRPRRHGGPQPHPEQSRLGHRPHLTGRGLRRRRPRSLRHIRDNAATFSAAVADLKQRFGVERVNVVGYCKGGIDAREHVRRNDDVDRLIMVATPQAGSFLADSMLVSPNTLIWEGEDPKKVASSLRELSGPRMRSYNRYCRQNPRTVYASEAVLHNSPFANAWLPVVGLNDEFVSL